MTFKIEQIDRNSSQEVKDSFTNEIFQIQFETFEKLQEYLIEILGKSLHRFLNNPGGKNPNDLFSVYTIPTGCMVDQQIRDANIFFRNKSIARISLLYLEEISQ